MKKSIITLCTVSAIYSTSIYAQDTRSVAMGGTGVASSDYLSAGFNNASLMTRHAKENDDFGIIVPSINLIASDNDKLFDSIDEFQSSFEQLENLLSNIENGVSVDPNALAEARSNAIADFVNLNGSVDIFGNGLVALASPTKAGGFALYANVDLDVNAIVLIDSQDIVTLNTAITVDSLNEVKSTAQMVGAAVAEVGFAYANQFTLSNHIWHWSITPKYQQVETFNYVIDVNNFDEDNFDANDYTNSGKTFNIDLGFATQVSDSITFGIVAKNLVEKEFNTVNTLRGPATYHVSREVIAGIAYKNDFITLAADIDLQPRQHSSITKDTQFARVGAEFNAWDWAQIRVGYIHDLEGNRDGIVTAGLGFSPFGVVRLDIAAQKAGDSDLGAGIQLSFTL